MGGCVFNRDIERSDLFRGCTGVIGHSGVVVGFPPRALVGGWSSAQVGGAGGRCVGSR